MSWTGNTIDATVEAPSSGRGELTTAVADLQGGVENFWSVTLGEGGHTDDFGLSDVFCQYAGVIRSGCWNEDSREIVKPHSLAG